MNAYDTRWFKMSYIEWLFGYSDSQFRELRNHFLKHFPGGFAEFTMEGGMENIAATAETSVHRELLARLMSESWRAYLRQGKQNMS